MGWINNITKLYLSSSGSKLSMPIWRGMFAVFVNSFGTMPMLFLSLYNEYQLDEQAFSNLFLINTVLIVLFQVVIVDLASKYSLFLSAAVGAFLVGFGMYLLILGNSYFLRYSLENTTRIRASSILTKLTNSK